METKKLLIILSVMALTAGAQAQVNTSPSSRSAADNVSAQEDYICELPEVNPQFPGGQSALMAYLQTNLHYPPTAAKKGVEGRVLVSFVVEKDGTIGNAEIVRSRDAELDAEALRVVKAMPNWKPATLNGSPVRVKFNLPITFSLPQKKK